MSLIEDYASDHELDEKKKSDIAENGSKVSLAFQKGEEGNIDIELEKFKKIAQGKIDLTPMGVHDIGDDGARIYREAKYLPANITARSLWAPERGPLDPNDEKSYHVEKHGPNDVEVVEGSIPLPKDGSSGYSEKTAVNELAFEDLYHGGRFLKRKKPVDSSELQSDGERRKIEKRHVGGVPGENYLGPWAGWAEDKIGKEDITLKQHVYMKQRERRDLRKQKQKDEKEKAIARKISGDAESEEKGNVKKTGEERSEFHGTQRFDYQGRSFLAAPSSLKNKPHSSYIPKKCVHTWTGHTKAVSCAFFFPHTGHFIMSCSMDGTARLWRVPDKETGYEDGSCVYTYHAHDAGIRDMCYNYDGTRVITAGYDRVVKLWDIEYGKCLVRFRNKSAIPFCCRFNPSKGKQYHILAGYSDNKIVQFDARSGRVAQIYNQHLSSVNTITFCEGNRRFMSTSDDKSLRIWEYGIPEQIKYIADPSMNAIPAVTMHPDGKHFLCQSLDNFILIYEAFGRFKLQKKRFSGHLIAGYACRPTASPNGAYIASGDSTGGIWFWDWKSGKDYKRQHIKNAHGSSVVICTDWHPIYPSKVASAGWDGTVKLWD